MKQYRGGNYGLLNELYDNVLKDDIPKETLIENIDYLFKNHSYLFEEKDKDKLLKVYILFSYLLQYGEINNKIDLISRYISNSNIQDSFLNSYLGKILINRINTDILITYENIIIPYIVQEYRYKIDLPQINDDIDKDINLIKEIKDFIRTLLDNDLKYYKIYADIFNRENIKILELYIYVDLKINKDTFKNINDDFIKKYTAFFMYYTLEVMKEYELVIGGNKEYLRYKRKNGKRVNKKIYIINGKAKVRDGKNNKNKINYISLTTYKKKYS